MVARRFMQVDVFTKVPFRGNPVAVVLESAGLSAGDMQRIAAWTNLSETTFLLPPSSAAADYRLRIFTPRAELPFAGHPTIGSAHAVIEAGIVKPKGGKLRQECGAGVLDLEVDGATIWLDAPPATDTPVDAVDLDFLEKILKAKSTGVPRIMNVGPRWLIADLGGAGEVAALAPDMAALAELSNRLSIGGVTVYGTATDGRSAVHVRSFAPAHGIPEDPVCGSGNISVAAYLMATGRSRANYVARQGMQMGRDGEVSIRYDGKKIFLGGSSVTCVDGLLQG
ncbi:MAG TPA: PhzF family phenazine biosynthesis protein [Burkholderiales bacterium]|nr:PhzF family phenazine biosynthesis protein [Burkholderiales bacterium]